MSRSRLGMCAAAALMMAGVTLARGAQVLSRRSPARESISTVHRREGGRGSSPSGRSQHSSRAAPAPIDHATDAPLPPVIRATYVRTARPSPHADSVTKPAESRDAYAGFDANGIPRYVRRSFTPDERRLLRDVFGIEEPGQLYLTDTTADGYLAYDTRPKRCRLCMVNTYRVGARSVRQPGETWEALERRLASASRKNFPEAVTRPSTSLDDLSPAVRDAFADMLRAARRAGFEVQVIETYRSPERAAFLFWAGRGRTMTVTSRHTDGRAVDIVVGGQSPRHFHATADWIRFRRWVLAYGRGRFRLIGTPDDTWDWPHIELASPDLGFHSIDDALAAARTCEARRRAMGAEIDDAALAECGTPGAAASAPTPRGEGADASPARGT